MSIVYTLIATQPGGSIPWGLLGLLFGLTLVISAVGFYRAVYFISIGYAFSMVGIAAVALLALRDGATFWGLGQITLLIVWGLRLGIFLLRREMRSNAYRTGLAKTHQQYQDGLGVKLLVWLGVSVLYVAMFSPVLFDLLGRPFLPDGWIVPVQALGMIVMAGGLVLETLADKQKSDFKAQAPDRFVDQGLYRWVRSPNYLGEIVFWVGSWLMGLPFYSGLLPWAFSAIGLVCIVLIMLGSTKRLELSQEKRYGHLAEYQAYVGTVPVLIPFVPLYSLKKIRV